ncbi:hypothetical protein ACNKHM_06780 [Shigella sonnei]
MRRSAYRNCDGDLLANTPLCPAGSPFYRWGDTARAVGMALTPTRIALLLLAACLTATATMTIGPSVLLV